MKRITAILIAITLLFSAGATLADDTGEANKLFVEAMQLSMSTEDEGSLEKKAAALEASLAKFNEIFDRYPSTELAVKLISGQSVGKITLEGVRSAAENARRAVERAAENAREFEKALKAVEQGDVETQVRLGWMYYQGVLPPYN